MTEPTKKIAATEMSTAICEVVIKAVKEGAKPYKEMNESEQRRFINAIDDAIKQAIGKAVDVIVADKRVAVQCQVDQVVFKSGVKIVLKAGSTEASHDLADAEGQKVTVIITNKDKYTSGATPKPEKDQKPLFDGTKTAAAGGGAGVKKDPRTKRSGKR